MRDRDAVPADSRIPAPVRGFSVVASAQARILGRAYFAAQAVLGALWWIGVAVAPEVRRATLGALDPRWVAAFDIPLFVLASALAALGLRWPRYVAVTWTALVAMLARTRALAPYAPLRRACRDPRQQGPSGSPACPAA